MSDAAGLFRRMVGIGAQWDLDTALRYMPAVHFLRDHPEVHSILEVGSGSQGIGPYVDRQFVATDVRFPESTNPNLIPVIAQNPLPFRDRTFDVVLSLDTLEHVPRESRQNFVTEMLRLSRGYLLVGFPQGERSVHHDTEMEAYYTRTMGDPHEYFVDHRTYGIPREVEFAMYLEHATRQIGRHVSWRAERNASVALRRLYLRLLWHPARGVQRIYSAITPLARWDRLFRLGVCYRHIYFVAVQA
jgi:hypothetical protein